MTLIEKKTRRIEIDEMSGSHIQICDTTHLVDDDTGEVVHENVKNHRCFIVVGDDDGAKAANVEAYAKIAWTKEVRDAQKERVRAAEAAEAAEAAKAEETKS
jgi:hypothetical protein